MTKTLLLSLTLIALTACAKEEPKPLVCNTKPIQSPFELQIIDKPIDFGSERIAMTKEYIKSHYGKTVKDITITPKIILLHWTAEMSFDKSFKRLQPQRLLTDRKDIAKASLLNVSSHFMVARDGTIYRLMPENWMARHVIGLNYSSKALHRCACYLDDTLFRYHPLSCCHFYHYFDAWCISLCLFWWSEVGYLFRHHSSCHVHRSRIRCTYLPLYSTRCRLFYPGKKFMSDMRRAVKSLKLKTPPKVK